MPVVLHVRELTPEEKQTIHRLARSRTESARLAQRAQVSWLSAQGTRVSEPYPGCTIANRVDFLAKVTARVPAEYERVLAIVDNLRTHRAPRMCCWFRSQTPAGSLSFNRSTPPIAT